jgi:hypothetical protein
MPLLSPNQNHKLSKLNTNAQAVTISFRFCHIFFSYKIADFNVDMFTYTCTCVNIYIITRQSPNLLPSTHVLPPRMMLSKRSRGLHIR